jgi:hypothetical protein
MISPHPVHSYPAHVYRNDESSLDTIAGFWLNTTKLLPEFQIGTGVPTDPTDQPMTPIPRPNSRAYEASRIFHEKNYPRFTRFILFCEKFEMPHKPRRNRSLH